MSIMHASSTVMARTSIVTGDVITLSGSTGSPNTSLDFAISTANASVYWAFNADGTIDRIKTQGSDVYEIFGPTQWCNQTPESNHWIRFTHNAGDTSNFGSASGTWWLLTTAIGHGWEETRNGYFTTSGSSKVEISSDSGGGNIEATGYYGGTAEIEV